MNKFVIDNTDLFYPDSFDLDELDFEIASTPKNYQLKGFKNINSVSDLVNTNLSNQGISCGIHYPIALPKLEAYKYLNQYNEKGFAWISDNSLLSLPISDTINLNEVIEVSEALINSI